MTLFVRMTGEEAAKRKINRLQETSKEEIRKKIDSLFVKERKKIVAFIKDKIQKTNSPGIRSKQLIRSIEGISGRFRGIPSIKIGVFRLPAAKYATTVEEGTKGENINSSIATIVPKKPNIKALAVPNEKDPRVVTSRRVKKYESPRKYPGKLKFIPFTKSGIAIGGLYDVKDLAHIRTNKLAFSSIAPLYFLLKRVDIPPYPYLRENIKEYLPILNQEVTKLIFDYFESQK